MEEKKNQEHNNRLEALAKPKKGGDKYKAPQYKDGR